MTAKADSHPQGGDSSEAPFMTSAVPEGHSPETSVRTPPTGEGELARGAQAVHTFLSRRDIMQYLDNEEDCEGIAKAVITALSTKGEDKLPQAVKEALEDYNSCLRSACSVAERHGANTGWPALHRRLKAILDKHHSTWLEYSTFRDRQEELAAALTASPTTETGDV